MVSATWSFVGSMRSDFATLWLNAVEFHNDDDRRFLCSDDDRRFLKLPLGVGLDHPTAATMEGVVMAGMMM